ncbi:MAG: hypothetical protein Q8M92_04035 [Candidatus Subteraquimicrobiales bacterium]|nr:hypothetical protein [Candidatus Subteraquimicrobiales bacterium]
MAIIDDLKTSFQGNYYEELLVKGGDYRMCEDHYTLWQALVGEIKTKKGECLGVGLENYGCDIWRTLGENMDPLLEKEIEKYIHDLAPKYPQIKELTVEQIFYNKEGQIDITIIVVSIFNKTMERVIIGGPC